MHGSPAPAPGNRERCISNAPHAVSGSARRASLRLPALFAILLAAASCLAAAADDTLLGVTWVRSVLVSFDPRTGAVLARHLQLNPREAFRGLAYDPNHHRLYALAQGTHNLYWVDTETLQLTHVGNLHFQAPASSPLGEAGVLAYDPSRDLLYTAVESWEGPNYSGLGSALCTVDPSSAGLRCQDRINGPFIDGLGYNAADGQLYGVAVYGSGSWDSPTKANVARIRPETGEMGILFPTPYHTIMGFAAAGPFAFYSWINWTSHMYGLIDIFSQTVTGLGSSDGVEVISAMERRDFPLASAPLNPQPAPASFVFAGHVTAVWDPQGILGKEIARGRSFSGRFSYDTTSPYRYVDPNSSPPFGLSVRINRLLYSGSSMKAAVTDNSYSIDGQFKADGFFLTATDRNRKATITWSLGDSTASALSGNALLPAELDLSEWERNTFVISGGGPFWDDEPRYLILGKVDHISPGKAFDPSQIRQLRIREQRAFELPDDDPRIARPLPPHHR
jgi:hypothetical protein